MPVEEDGHSCLSQKGGTKSHHPLRTPVGLASRPTSR